MQDLTKMRKSFVFTFAFISLGLSGAALAETAANNSPKPLVAPPGEVHKGEKPEVPNSLGEINTSNAYQYTNQASTAGSTHIEVITFAKNSRAIAPAEANKLTKVVSDLKQRIRILEIKIAAWSDKPYPVNAKSRLTHEDRVLAEKRGMAVQDLIARGTGINDIEIVNMAERPGYLAKFFRTDSAELKSAFAKRVANSAPTATPAGKMIPSPAIGGPSTAVVIIYLGRTMDFTNPSSNK